MPLEGYHNTPPDASFSGTGSSAWVEAHNLRMESGALVGRFSVGTGAPESIVLGSNLSVTGGTLNAAGGTGAAGVSLVQGVAPILVGGTATSTVSIATSGVTAGTYGGPLVIPRFDVSAQGLIQSASQAGTIGTMASFNSYMAAGDVLGTSTTGTLTAALSTTGVAAGTYGTGGTMVAQISVDAKGRILTATNVGIIFPASTGGGISALVGDVSGTSTTGTLTNALSTTGVSAGTYGGTLGIPRFDIDAKGRVLSAATHPLEGSTPIVVTTGAGTFVLSHATSGVAAGTYGTGRELVQLAVDARGHLTAVATSATIGTMASFNSYVAAGDALGTSTTGTLTVALSTTGVTAGTYGNGTAVSQVVVDAKGRVTSASNVNISFPAAEGTSTFALAGDVLGTGLVPGTLTSALSTTGITAGTYGGTAGIPRFDIDAKGRMLSAASHPLQGSAPIAITTGAGTFVVSHNTSGVAAGTYGDGTAVAQVVVNALGHLTAGTSVPITFPPVRVLEATAPIAVATAAGTYTVSHNTSGISAGTYGGTLGVARFGVSVEGHVTAAANHALEATPPILLATNAGTFAWSHGTSGVAAGTFGTGNDLVQLTVNALGHVTSVATSGTLGTMGRFSSYTMAGAALGTSTTGTMTVTLSTTGVSAGTYGDATNVGQFTVDAGGRIILATNVAIAGGGTLSVTQGTTTVSSVTRVHFTTNVTVTSTATGVADVAVTPADASETVKGIIELATQAEVDAMTDTSRALTPNHNKIVLGTEQASTSGTSIDFTGIPAGVRRITIMFDGVSTNGNDSWLVQIGDSGGIEPSGYDSTSTLADSAVISAGSTAGFILRTANAARVVGGATTLDLEDSTNNVWVARHNLNDKTAAVATFTGAGRKALSATLDRVRITTTGGTQTFDAGAINISYER